MNALVRKEIRLLLPAWVLAMILATLPVWIFDHPAAAFDETVWMAFIPGIMLIGLSSFGQEFSGKTFSLLLAQPVSRSRIWNMKIGFLSVALLSSWLVFFASNRLFLAANLVSFQNGRPSDTDNVLLWFTVIIAMVSTVLWTTILFRQAMAAFGISLLLPPVVATFLIAGLEWLTPAARTEHHINITAGLLAAYSILGVLWARRMFLRAQDVLWTGGDVSIAAIPIPFVNSTFKRGTSSWWRTVMFLFKKELQLQQMSLMFALGGIAAHLASLLLRKFVHASGNGITAALIDKSWIFAWICWTVLPMFSGSVAVAEERKLGTLEGHLCLPVSRGLQFAVKLATVMFISVGLGWGLLYSFEWIGDVFGAHSELLSEFNGPIWALPLGWAWMGLIAIYCSSLARNALQALGLTVVAWMLSGMLYGIAVSPYSLFHAWLWTEPLGPYVIGTFMAAGLLILAWSNFKRIHLSRRLLARNLGSLILLTLLSMSVTAFTYNREWELVLPMEPKHGAEKISYGRPVKIARLASLNPTFFVLLPDGKLWKSETVQSFHYWQEYQNAQPLNCYFDVPKSGSFVPDSSWKDIACIWNQAVAIRDDGTLWLLEDRRNTNRAVKAWDTVDQTFPTPRQIGNETNWIKLAAGNLQLMALKKDGTLWGFGLNQDGILTNETNRYIPDLIRVGSASDWTSIRYHNGYPVGQKTDGTEWAWGAVSEWTGKSDIVGCSGPVLKSNPDSHSLVIRKDGSLWVRRYYSLPGNHTNWKMAEGRLGAENDWLMTNDNEQDLFALKTDGRLIHGQVIHTPRIESMDWVDASISGKIISSNSDWMSLSSQQDAVFVLAKDGTLSAWATESYYRQKILSRSRLPIASVNLFENISNR